MEKHKMKYLEKLMTKNHEKCKKVSPKYQSINPDHRIKKNYEEV